MASEQHPDILELSRQLAAKEKECASLRADLDFWQDQLRTKEDLHARHLDELRTVKNRARKLDWMEPEYWRLLQLAQWGAEQGGDRCDSCVDAAMETYQDHRGRTPHAIEFISDDDVEAQSEKCERPDCVGGWRAYVPKGEKVTRGTEAIVGEG